MNDQTQFLEFLIGSSEADAIEMIQSSNYSYRVTSRDGVRFMLTMDVDFNRINLDIDKNRVIKAKFG